MNNMTLVSAYDDPEVVTRHLRPFVKGCVLSAEMLVEELNK